MRKHRTPEQWQALVDQQLNSGLSAVQFCKQEHLGYATFCHWRKRLSVCPTHESQTTSDAHFLDLTSMMASAAPSSQGWNIVLSLGNGVELRLSQNA